MTSPAAGRAAVPDPRIQRLAHALVHRDRLAPEAAQRTLRESYALDLPIEAIEDALEATQCQHCSPSAPETARQQQGPAAAVHQVWDGWLTSTLKDPGE
jgi:hypothetical protein